MSYTDCFDERPNRFSIVETTAGNTPSDINILQNEKLHVKKTNHAI